MKFGIFVGEQLAVEYFSYEEALQDLNIIYEETGIPHELKALEGE